MDSQQAMEQISNLYVQVGANLWSMFGDLIVVVTALLSCSLIILGMRKIKGLIDIAQNRHALNNLEMERGDLSDEDPIGHLELESNDYWEGRKSKKSFNYY